MLPLCVIPAPILLSGAAVISLAITGTRSDCWTIKLRLKNNENALVTNLLNDLTLIILYSFFPLIIIYKLDSFYHHATKYKNFSTEAKLML